MFKRPFLFVAVVAAFASSPAWSGNFTVGVEGHDYLPISKGEGGAYSGYARDLFYFHFDKTSIIQGQLVIDLITSGVFSIANKPVTKSSSSASRHEKTLL